MRLVKASPDAPASVCESVLAMYAEASPDDGGFRRDIFGESDVVSGKISLTDHLQWLADMGEGRNLRPGWVPSTTYWLLDESETVAGVGRLRHELTPGLLNDGGHIGYYVRPAYRGQGCGTAILEQLLPEAQGLGIDRVLLTVRVHNTPSIRIIEGRGGVLEDERVDLEGVSYRRYWIDLTA
jgi:predicted acetyltransferase